MGKTTKKIKKGDFGYISRQRKITIVRTLILYGISIGIFLGGYVTHGRDIRNILTIVAVLGFLPASKSMVNVIMLLKARGCSEKAKARILESGENFHHYFDFYFTAYHKNYSVSHMMLFNQVLMGITEWVKCDCNECEKHLKSHLKQDGLKEIAVKIYDNMDKYCEKLAELHYEYDPLADTVSGSDREERVFDVMKAISL